MRILIVKLSSLGDVVHALPVVADIRARFAGALIDWVVEPAFAPLLHRVEGIAAVIELPLRRWGRGGWPSAAVAGEALAFVRRLRRERYDAVVDLQGLTKSAIVAALARGPSHGLANRTEGASHEAPARWLATHAHRLPARIHALDRSRELVRRALGVATESPPAFGLRPRAVTNGDAGAIVFVPGSSRADKRWPEASWIELGRLVVAAGDRIGLAEGNDEEAASAARIAAAIGAGVSVWPRLELGAFTERLAGSGGVIGVDSGPSHIAVALGLPHVQIYNHPTAWRTGPIARQAGSRQVAVEGVPMPTVAAVWSAWLAVREAAAARPLPAAPP